MHMEEQEFNELAKRTFGDLVEVGPVPEDILDWNNGKRWKQRIHGDSRERIKFSREEVNSLGDKVWIKTGNCPECASALGAYFVWGLIWGMGHCSHCGKASFRYYHMIENEDGDRKVLLGYSLCGFNSDPEEEKG